MQVPTELAEQVARGQVAAFGGSGLSVNAGLPTWREFLNQLIRRSLEERPRAPGPEVNELFRLARGTPLEMLILAQELRERMQPARLKEFLEKVFRSDQLQPTSVHKLLTQMPFSAMLTTNYDKLLESAYARFSSIQPKVILPRNTPALASILSDKNFYIFKVHGDIDDIDSLILGLGDYRQMSHANPACRVALEAILRERTILFLGYSLSDPDFTLFLDEVRSTFGGYGRGHYALMEAAQAPPITRKRFEQDFGITIIPYTSSGPTHPEVEQFLRSLLLVSKRTVARRRRFSSPPVRIGVLHSLSGTMAMSEQPLVDAAMMAVEEVNQEGGVLGRRLECTIEDGESEEAAFQRKAEKLVERHSCCSLFGCWTSAARKAVIPIVEGRSLLWYPLQHEGGESHPNVIYTGATPNQQILPAVDWCVNERQWRRVFLVGSDYIYPKEAHRIIQAHLNVVGAECVGVEYIPFPDWNVDQVVAEIHRCAPDVIFNTLNGDTNVPFFRSLARRVDRPRIPVMSFSIGEVELRHIGSAALVNHYCSWNYFMSIDAPENRRFVSEFKRRFGSERVTSDPIEAAYFQIKLFAEAARSARTTNWREIRDAVRGMEFVAPGGRVTIDSKNQHVWSEARIGEIRPDGQFKIVWTSERPIPPEPFKYQLSGSLENVDGGKAEPSRNRDTA